MSVIAYRVNANIIEDVSFNVYQDKKLVNFIETESEAGFFSCLNSYGSGEVDVPLNVLRQAVKAASKLDLSQDTISRLKDDIAFAISKKDESVTYSCF